MPRRIQHYNYRVILRCILLYSKNVSVGRWSRGERVHLEAYRELLSRNRDA